MSRLHILLLILKIIGILILVVLGILLALLLFVLFVPIRYRIDGEKESQSSLKGKVRLSWLLHILSLQILLDEEVSISMKIFGISVFPREKNKKVKSKNKSKQVSKHKEKTIKKSNKKKEEAEPKPINRNPVDEGTVFANEFKIEKKEEHTKKQGEIIPTHTQEKRKEKEQNQQPEKMERKKKNIFYKIQEKIIWFWSEVKKKYQQIHSFWETLRYRWSEFLDKRNILIRAWNDKENQGGMVSLWKTAKRLLQHITPRKWTGYIHFGMNNPENTGKILGLIAIFGGIIGILPEIQPDFEKEIFEGKVMLKGRIYLFYLIQLFITIWRKKEVHKLIDNIKKLWEELSWQKTI